MYSYSLYSAAVAEKKGHLTEAYFWYMKAVSDGAEHALPSAQRISSEWVRRGCPKENTDLLGNFTDHKARLARCHMRVANGIDMERSYHYLISCRYSGDRDAAIFV